MSSLTYSSHLKPDPWCRIVLRISGQLLIAVGMVVILTMPLEPWLRGLGALGWWILGYAELVRQRHGQDACTEVQLFSDGELRVLGCDGQWRPAALLSGSLVLRHWAWFRYRPAGGPVATELLRGDGRKSREWRRLRVIWQHIGST